MNLGTIRRLEVSSINVGSEPGLCENFELLWKIEFPSQFRSYRSHQRSRIRHEAKTKKTIFDEFRLGTFSHSLGQGLPYVGTRPVYLR
jgi:hypothetical protein